MALKAIMLRNRIDKKMSELEELRKKDEEFLNREAELETAINEAVTEEEQQVVSEQVDAFDAEKTEHEEAKTRLQGEIDDLEAQLSETEKEPPAEPVRLPVPLISSVPFASISAPFLELSVFSSFNTRFAPAGKIIAVSLQCSIIL